MELTFGVETGTGERGMTGPFPWSRTNPKNIQLLLPNLTVFHEKCFYKCMKLHWKGVFMTCRGVFLHSWAPISRLEGKVTSFADDTVLSYVKNKWANI